MTSARRLALPLTLAALSLAGCGSLGSTTAAGAPSSAPSAAPSSAPVAAASSAPCSARACIVADAQSMVGTVAKDESVLTKMACRKATVKHAAPGVWTVHCTATYSDGSVWAGIASVLLSKGRVTWEATGMISGS